MERAFWRARAVGALTIAGLTAAARCPADIDPMSDYVPISGNPKKLTVAPTTGNDDPILNLGLTGSTCYSPYIGGLGNSPKPPANVLLWAQIPRGSLLTEGGIFGSFGNGLDLGGIWLRGVGNQPWGGRWAFRTSALFPVDGSSSGLTGTVALSSDLMPDGNASQVILTGGASGGLNRPSVAHASVAFLARLARLESGALSDLRKHATASEWPKQYSLARGIDTRWGDRWMTIEAGQVWAPSALGGNGQFVSAKISQSLVVGAQAPWVVDLAYNWGHNMSVSDNVSFGIRLPLDDHPDPHGKKADPVQDKTFLEFSVTTDGRCYVGLAHKL